MVSIFISNTYIRSAADPFVPFVVPAAVVHLVSACRRFAIDDLRRVPFSFGIAGLKNVAHLVRPGEIMHGTIRGDGTDDEIPFETGRESKARELVLLVFHLIVEKALGFRDGDSSIVVAVHQRVPGEDADEALGEGPVSGG